MLKNINWESILLKIRFNGIMRSLIRSVTPLFAAVLTSDLFNQYVTEMSNGETNTYLVVAYSVYYTIVRNIEGKWPKSALLLLGAKGAPIYEIDNSQEEIAAIGAEEALMMSDGVKSPAIPYA